MSLSPLAISVIRSAAAVHAARQRHSTGGKGLERLHLQEGPIDLIIGADGPADQVREAYRAAMHRFDGLLQELCNEIRLLRQPAHPHGTLLGGIVARRMYAAVAPFGRDQFITPMAAVAGAVAEEVLQAMLGATVLTRAYVNNGGDIAFHLAGDEIYSVGLVDRPDRPALTGRIIVSGESATRGIATSGRHGRSFSCGIADAVTALARTAAQADAAATVIANAVDLPGHPGIMRCAARDIQIDNDLGDILVTRDVIDLSPWEISDALDAGEKTALELLNRGLIDGAVLRLQGGVRLVERSQDGFRHPRAPTEQIELIPDLRRAPTDRNGRPVLAT
jgi:ApbE superfamily uncharacterized protein (UPF0280 family)